MLGVVYNDSDGAAVSFAHRRAHLSDPRGPHRRDRERLRQSFDDEDLDAVAKFANDTEYGLQASVWTQNLRVADLIARKIKAGPSVSTPITTVIRRGHSEDTSNSGWRREMGKEVMEHYTETKSVAARL